MNWKRTWIRCANSQRINQETILLSNNGYSLSAETRFASISESSVAEMRIRWGNTVRYAHGQYWAMTSLGFYRPTHWLARMSAEEAIRPSWLCWGFHTTLCSADAGHANGTLPLHILSAVDEYDINSLSPRRRNKLRNCYKQVEFIEVLRPDLLAGEGFEVVLSSQERTGYRRWRSEVDYQNYINSFLFESRGNVIAGRIDGKIKALVTCFTVGSTAYIDSIDIASDALDTNIGSGIVFETAQIARRSGFITELVNSPHTPEKPSLTNHKVGMGFDLVHVPSRTWFMPPTETLVRLLKPEAHYRITGGASNVLDHNRVRTENCYKTSPLERKY